MLSRLKQSIERRRGSHKRFDKALVRLKDAQWSFVHKDLPKAWDQVARLAVPFYGRDLLRQLTPYAVPGFEDMVRLGKPSDGGYVLPKAILPLIEAVYTYGVAGDISFEEDLARHVSVPMRLYDHTVDALPASHEGFTFKKQGIAASQHGAFDTLSHHLAENGDMDKQILLKVDIEGYEWDIIPGIVEAEAGHIAAIVLEAHEFDRYAYLPSFRHILTQLNSRFTLVHIHGNNTCGTVRISGKDVPVLCELTLINNRLVGGKKPLREPLPSAIDVPNQAHLKDIPLDFWMR